MSSLTADEAPNYRPHIDGLRALAVAVVILFHAGVPGIDGGYVGVDVFFVISGFLITRWIETRQDRSPRRLLSEFYARRGRRILPALLFVLAVTSVAACWILQPSHLEVFAKLMAPAVVLLGNFGAWRYGGYFGWNASDMPLLHLWSIGVEEQFYLFYPLLLLWITRRWPRMRIGLIAILAVVSFAVCVWASQTHPPANYYLLPTRAWELLLGALVALGVWPRMGRVVRESVALLSVLAILVACLSYKRGVPYPGWLTLAPCLGTAALIAAGEQGRSLVNSVLSWRPIVFTGLLSYSLYLWHMPVIGLFRYWNIVETNALDIVLLCAGIYLLSLATWRWVELPFRRRRVLAVNWRFWVTAAAVSLSMFVLSTITGVRYGRERALEELAKTNPEIAAVTRLRADRCMGADIADIRSGKLCRFGPVDAKRRVIVWGDSHTWALVGLFKDIAERDQVQVFLAQYPACRPLIGAVNVSGCEKFNAAMVDAVHVIDPQLVIFSAYWHSPIEELKANDDLSPGGQGSLFTRGLTETLRRIGSPPRSVCVVKTVPRLHYRGEYAVAMARQRGIDTSFIQLSRADAYAQDAEMDHDIDALAAQGRITAVNLKDALCGPVTCRYLMDDGSSIYRDDSHVTPAGANLLAAEVARCFDTHVAERSGAQ